MVVRIRQRERAGSLIHLKIILVLYFIFKSLAARCGVEHLRVGVTVRIEGLGVFSLFALVSRLSFCRRDSFFIFL